MSGSATTPPEGTPIEVPADGPGDTADAPADAGQPAARAAGPVTHADTGVRLRELFPALFTGPAKPLKLRIQADIQQRAPGVFTKQALSAFLRRHTGSHAYLVALTQSGHRYDLDGQPADPLSAEHRAAAAAELARRRAIVQQRRDAEESERTARARLLQDFDRTTLTPANFCALKGISADQLDGLLEQARAEASAARNAAPRGFDGGGRSGPRRPPKR